MLLIALFGRSRAIYNNINAHRRELKRAISPEIYTKPASIFFSFSFPHHAATFAHSPRPIVSLYLRIVHPVSSSSTFPSTFQKGYRSSGKIEFQYTAKNDRGMRSSFPRDNGILSFLLEFAICQRRTVNRASLVRNADQSGQGYSG